MKEIWTDIYEVHSYEVNLEGELTIRNLCQFMQESAWKHAEELGVGFSHLIKKNLAWILSKMKIKIFSFPKWGEKITINTWPSGYDKLFCYREFEIKNENGDILVNATSTWLVIDVNSRRPQRTETYFSREIEAGKLLFENHVPKITLVEGKITSSENSVMFKDIDVNGHLTNIRYIEWALDGFSYDERISNKLTDLEINFINEAIIDDEIIINKLEIDTNTFQHNLVRKKDSKELCRLQTCWQKK